jgi:rhodanese-related sulfurtransferase
VEANLGDLPARKNKPMVVYCDSGAEANTLSTALKSHGFEDVVNSGTLGRLLPLQEQVTSLRADWSLWALVFMKLQQGALLWNVQYWRTQANPQQNAPVL